MASNYSSADNTMLSINILGHLSISYGGRTMTPENCRSGKAWTLFEYLFISRDREVTQENLVNFLWPDMSVSDPSNSLKALVFKLRNYFDRLGYPGRPELIVRRGSSYAFNDALEFVLDAAEMEKAAAEAEKLTGEEKKQKLFEAMSFFKGTAKQKKQYESWAYPIHSQFNQLYLDIASNLITIYQEEGSYDAAVNICKIAITVMPYEEALYSYLLKTLIAQENYSEAAEVYENVQKMMLENYGQQLDTRILDLHREILTKTVNKEETIEELQDELCEKGNYVGCLYCGYEQFTVIYHLEARIVRRTERTSFLCMFTLKDNAKRSRKEQQAKNFKLVGEALAFSLRQNDVFTRISENQFGLLLSNLTAENVQMVYDRINRYFQRVRTSEEFELLMDAKPVQPSVYTPALPSKE